MEFSDGRTAGGSRLWGGVWSGRSGRKSGSCSCYGSVLLRIRLGFTCGRLFVVEGAEVTGESGV